MGTERVPIHSIEGWIKNVDRRAASQERRPAITRASDLLGPGFGPSATEVNDWNQDEAAFNGMFWSSPGAQNSPDTTLFWVGLTITEDKSFGMQTIWSDRTDPVRRLTRRFFDPGGGFGRTYSAWLGDTDWQTTGITGLSGATINSQGWRTAQGGVVSVSVSIILGADITVPSTGDVGNIALALVPTAIRPRLIPLAQGLTSTAFGSVSSWSIGSSGNLILNATTPNTTLAAGTTISASGVYLI